MERVCSTIGRYLIDWWNVNIAESFHSLHKSRRLHLLDLCGRIGREIKFMVDQFGIGIVMLQAEEPSITAST